MIQHHYNTQNNTTLTTIIQQQQQHIHSNVVSFKRYHAFILFSKKCCNVVFTSENHVVLALYHGVSVVIGQPLPSIDSHQVNSTCFNASKEILRRTFILRSKVFIKDTKNPMSLNTTSKKWCMTDSYCGSVIPAVSMR